MKLPFNLDQIFWHCLGLTVFFLCFGIFPSNILILLDIIILAICLIQSKKKIKLRFSIVLLLPILYLLLTISLFYSSNWESGLTRLARYLPLFVVPLIIFFLDGFTKRQNVILNYFFAGIVGIVCLSLGNAVISSLKWNDSGVLVFDSSVRGGYKYYESILNGGNYFVGGDLSPFIHPTYLSTYILIAISIILFYKKKLFWLLPILFGFTFLLSSRAALLTIPIVSVYLVFTMSKYKVITILASILFAIIIYTINPRMKLVYERVKQLTEKDSYRYTNSEQSRLLSWYASLTLIKEAPIFGYGVGDAKYELLKRFKELKFESNYKKSHNSHNQYLQTTLEIGIIGLVILVIPMILCLKQKDRSSKCIALIFLVIFLFESLLSRYNGIVLYSIIIPLCMSGFFNDKKIEHHHPDIKL